MEVFSVVVAVVGMAGMRRYVLFRHVALDAAAAAVLVVAMSSCRLTTSTSKLEASATRDQMTQYLGSIPHLEDVVAMAEQLG